MRAWLPCDVKDCPCPGPHMHPGYVEPQEADIRKAMLEVLLEIRDLLKEIYAS